MESTDNGMIGGVMMNKFIACVVLLLTGIFGIIAIANADGFDMSILENETNKKLFSYAHEDDYVFIDAKLSTEEKAFVHKNDSQYYYSTIYPDIIVINHNTDKEYSVPRLWIDYCSDIGGINAHTLELVVGECTYSFSLDEPESKQLRNNTIRESYLIRFGSEGLKIVSDWYKSALYDDETIYAKLIGKEDSVDFSVPPNTAVALAFTFLLFKSAGGYDTIDEVIGTPMSVSGISDATLDSILREYSSYEYGNEYIFEEFSIRFPKRIVVYNVNDYEKGVYGKDIPLFQANDGTRLWAINKDSDLYVKISLSEYTIDQDRLRTMGCPSYEIEDTYKDIFSYNDARIPEGVTFKVFKTTTTNFLGRSYFQEGYLKYMLKYLWAHDGYTYYLSIDVGHYNKSDVSIDEMKEVLQYLETLNTL